MTTAAEITQREQQLDEEGHDDDCPVFSDGECAGPPICNANTSQRAAPKRPRKQWVKSPADDVVLSGAHAAAFRRWQQAMVELRTAKERFAAAGAEAQAAHEALANLTVGPGPA